jgi:hypothetical protein
MESRLLMTDDPDVVWVVATEDRLDPATLGDAIPP